MKQPTRPGHGGGNGARQRQGEIQVPYRQLKVGKDYLRVLVLREVGAVEGADELGKLPFGEELVLRLTALGEGVGESQCGLELAEWACNSQGAVGRGRKVSQLVRAENVGMGCFFSKDIRRSGAFVCSPYACPERTCIIPLFDRQSPPQIDGRA